jgi:hypothetical protein
MMWCQSIRWLFVAALSLGPLAAQPAEPAPILAADPLAVAATNLVSGPAAGPRIQFAEPTYDFGEIQAGELVKHDFVFTNLGTETLRIDQVRTSCGCTAAGQWDRELAPGATGKIPIQFTSASFRGQVLKTVTVISNDPRQTNTPLQLKGKVWVPVEVNPSSVMFQYDGESSVVESRTVRIVSNVKEPLVLSELSCTNPAFKAELKEEQPGKEFTLQISTVPPVGTGMITAPVTLKTSSTNLPQIRVLAYAIERLPIMISPSQIMLPAGPLTLTNRPVVTIRSSSTNALVLSDVTIGLTNVEVQVREVQPGRLYNLIATFPPGFQLPAGQRPELSVKSNHPKFPLIRIPVYQSIQVARSPARVLGTPSRTNLTVPPRPVLPRTRSVPADQPTPPAPPALVPTP